MNKTVRYTLDVIWFLVCYLLLQFAIFKIGILLCHVTPTDGRAVAIMTVISSAFTLGIFFWCKWTPFNRVYLSTRPWAELVWVALLAFGTIMPSDWLGSMFHLELPPTAEQLYLQMMHEPWGYIAIGILAPLTEEAVFRGAILRTLLRLFSRRWHWMAIAISALAFAVCHGNAAQGIHALLIGLLLGWMYYRTGSIIPGVVFHWVNNTIAYVVCNLMPGLTDTDLIDLCGGDIHKELLYVGFSLCIFFPAIYQLNLRFKKND